MSKWHWLEGIITCPSEDQKGFPPAPEHIRKIFPYAVQAVELNPAHRGLFLVKGRQLRKLKARANER